VRHRLPPALSPASTVRSSCSAGAGKCDGAVTAPLPPPPPPRAAKMLVFGTTDIFNYGPTENPAIAAAIATAAAAAAESRARHEAALHRRPPLPVAPEPHPALRHLRLDSLRPPTARRAVFLVK
jgi:hypothetical protein